MWWFSASTWENHICKHSQDGLPLFPNDPAFTHLSPETLPPTLVPPPKSLPLNIILERAKQPGSVSRKKAKLPRLQNIMLKKVLLKKVKCKEMSRLPKLTQVTPLSYSEHLPTHVTLSFT